MTKSKLVSIIVPAYNAGNFIARCIENLLDQTYDNFEIIIVDDGSTDETAHICDTYANTCENVKVLHQENQGQFSARSAGIKAARGQYLIFVDSDDHIEREAIEYIMNSIGDEEPDMVAYGCIEESSTSTRKIMNSYDAGKYNKAEIQSRILPTALSMDCFYTFGFLLSLCTKMIKRSFYDMANVCVNQSVRYGEDADVVFQLLIKADTLRIIDYAPYHYIRRIGSMVSASVKPEAIKALYDDLKDAFVSSDVFSIMHPQLDAYITYVKLLKAPRLVLGEDFFKGKRIALYAAGEFGQAVYRNYSEDIALWVDANYEKYKHLPRRVEEKKCLLDKRDYYDYVYIAITDEKLCESIRDELVSMGIDCEIGYFRYDT